MNNIVHSGYRYMPTLLMYFHVLVKFVTFNHINKILYILILLFPIYVMLTDMVWWTMFIISIRKYLKIFKYVYLVNIIIVTRQFFPEILSMFIHMLIYTPWTNEDDKCKLGKIAFKINELNQANMVKNWRLWTAPPKE